MCENIKDQTTKTNQTYNTNNQIPNKYNSREERGGADEIISLIGQFVPSSMIDS